MKTTAAIEAFGSVKALADALGITVQAVYQWGEEVPALRAYQIEALKEKHGRDARPQTETDRAPA